MAPYTNIREKNNRLMNRIKGLITRKSRRGRRNKYHSTASLDDRDENCTVETNGADNDAKTVCRRRINTQFLKERSMPSSPSSRSLTTIFKSSSTFSYDPIHIILFIMDPETCQFELLELEFDSEIAKVSDIYKQIPIAANDKFLQNAPYKAIITTEGEELIHDVNLSEYVTDVAVAIAVPKSINASFQTCASTIKPILALSKVQNMVYSLQNQHFLT
jgi:hypothetical protein